MSSDSPLSGDRDAMAPDGSEHRPVPASTVALSAAAAGALAAAAAGVIDGLWSWSRLDQFLPKITTKLGFLAYLATTHALAGALAGTLMALGILALLRGTRLGDLFAAATRLHAQTRAKNPGDALIGLSLTIAGIPCVAGLLGLAYVLGSGALAQRKHMGLIIASAMGLALAALAASAVLSFVLARPVELALIRLARRPAWGRALSSLYAPIIAAAGLTGAAGLAAALAARDTLALLPLRPLWVTLAALAFAISTGRTGRALARRWPKIPRRPRRAAMAAAMAALILLILTTGRPDSVRKAASAYSGLGGPMTRALRTLADLDRDGYSSILGGGDCNDWNKTIHPGAPEIPDDGVDQNCVGGDPHLARSVDEVGFIAPIPSAVPQDFNVLLLTIDTLRADHLGAYGYERDTSPAMDAIAKDGALFVNAWAHAPSTRYSVPAILTGRHPLQVHYDTSIRGWPGIDDKNTTIAELMKQAGMTTGAILNYWYFTPERRMNQGFDHYDNQNQRLHKQVPGEGPAKTKGSSSKEQTDKALDFIRDHAAERFFLWTHYYDPHYEYEAHAEVPSFGPRPMDRYDQEIRFTDHHIGRLIDDLKRRGLYDRTIIIITGDHGEGFGEHGIDLHGYHLYAAQTKVPLIIRVPGVAPVVVQTPVGHVDILPTLANLAGLAPSTDMLGRSLAGAITGLLDPSQDRWVFQQLSYENNNEMRAAASKRCHVIYNVSPDTSWELYRIDEDPDETRDVIDAPGPCKEARGVLEAWYDRSEVPDGAARALLDRAPDIKDPLNVDFGAEIRLLAVDLPAAPVHAGEPFTIRYTFYAHNPLAGDFRVFAHFEGPQGRRFQGDHAPPRPFSWWRAGQYIAWDHTVTVPRGMAPGTYELWTGLFHRDKRRPVTSPGAPVRDDRVRVGAVRVVAPGAVKGP